jgi:hypothetical protein
LLRGDSPFSAGERELIGAYVFGPNGCNYCHAVGWTDRALHYAAAMCGLFNLMNRLADGLGVEAPESYTKIAAQRLAEAGYAQLLDLVSKRSLSPAKASE